MYPRTIKTKLKWRLFIKEKWHLFVKQVDVLSTIGRNEEISRDLPTDEAKVGIETRTT